LDFVIVLFAFLCLFIFFRNLLNSNYRIIKLCCFIFSFFLVFTVMVLRLGFRNIEPRELYDMNITEGYIYIDNNIFGLLENGGFLNYYDVELISVDHLNQTAVNKLKKYNKKYAQVWYYKDGIEGYNPTRIIYQIHIEDEFYHDVSDSNYNIKKDEFYVHEKLFIIFLIFLFTIVLYSFIWKISCILIK